MKDAWKSPDRSRRARYRARWATSCSRNTLTAEQVGHPGLHNQRLWT